MRAGAGGYPLLLLHGWPETKRIWWRNIEPLAAAGFEVIVPDLRGFGDSGLAPDGFYDPAAHARDLHALVRDVSAMSAAPPPAATSAAVVIQDLGPALRGLRRAPVPVQHGPAGAAGASTRRPASRPGSRARSAQAADYFRRQGRDADGLAAELDTPRAPASLHRAVLRLALLGRARAASTGRTSTS